MFGGDDHGAHGVCLVDDEVLKLIESGYLFDAVPLPLSHQWLRIVNQKGNDIELKPYGVGAWGFQARCLDPETKGIVHKNAHYVCSLVAEDVLG